METTGFLWLCLASYGVLPLGKCVAVHCNHITADATVEGLGGGIFASSAHGHKQGQQMIFCGVRTNTFFGVLAVINQVLQMFAQHCPSSNGLRQMG